MKIDHEANILSYLISNKANKEKKLSLLRKLNPSHFFAYGKEADFVWIYYEKYAHYCDIKVFSERFSNFVFSDDLNKIDYSIEFVVDKFLKSKVNKAVRDIITSAKSDDIKAIQSSESIRELMHVLDSGNNSESDAISWAHRSGRFSRYVQRKSGSLLSFKFPLASMGSLIRGLYAQDLMTLAAFPGVGKTWIACKFAHDAVMKQNLRTVFVSREISADDIIDRLDAIESKISWTRFRHGTLTKREEIMYQAAISRISKKRPNLFIAGTEKFNYTLDDLAKDVSSFEAEMIIIDGTHLLNVDSKLARDLTSQAYVRSRFIKSLARNSKAVVIQTIHAPSSKEDDDGETMRISGWGRSSWGASASQDSDYWGVMIAPQGRGTTLRELHIQKARNDKTGLAPFNMELDERVCFYDCKVDTSNIYCDYFIG